METGNEVTTSAVNVWRASLDFDRLDLADEIAIGKPLSTPLTERQRLRGPVGVPDPSPIHSFLPHTRYISCAFLTGPLYKGFVNSGRENNVYVAFACR